MLITMECQPRIPGEVYDPYAIKTALAARTFRIGESVQAGQLYADAYGGGDTFVIVSLEIKIGGGVFSTGLLDPGWDGKFSL
ncbi:MAG: hypothetical protein NTY01_08305, partial [Verrucomicrobia bacterium]|nr:hypothetical protein [Verrucomicrobiota bacterium]